MADLQRHGEALWTGDLRTGAGKTSTGSGVLREVPFSVPSRFENRKGTNPEELLAAAHASCFSMMLAKILGDMKRPPGTIHTQATLTLGLRSGGWRITSVHLQTEVSAAGLDEPTLQTAATQAKEQCPVSILLKPGLELLTMEVHLKSAG